MVILSEKDKWNIAHMEPNASKYCEYPEGIAEEVITQWMREVKELREWVKVSGRLHTDDDLEAERKAEEDGAQ